MRNYPHLLLLLCFFFLFDSMVCSSKTVSVQPTPPPQTESRQLSANEKQAHVQRIFNQLVDARGDLSVKKPELFWTQAEGNGAFFLPGTNHITFEEKTYGVCASFGSNTDNAIAYVLAHELIHYYKNHGWEAAFAKKFAGQEMTAEVKETIADIKQQETEADLLGGFLAFTAGFNTVGIAQDFLPKLYDSFGWPKENPKYPTLDERVLLAKTTEKELTTLIRMFNTANLLVAVDRYEDAIDYYNYVLSVYKSRELVNNVGVVSCLAAIHDCDYNEIKFAYPLELDGEARLRIGAKGISGLGSDILKRDSLLRNGIAYFKEAMQLDPAYYTAMLNIGCAHALLGLLYNKVDDEEKEINYDFASVYGRSVIRRAHRAGDQKLESDGWNLMGIIAANTGNGDPKELFQKAGADSPLAKANLLVLENGNAIQNVERKPKGMFPEEVESYLLDDFVKNAKGDTVIGVQGRNTMKRWAYNGSMFKQSQIYASLISRDNYILFHVTDPDYQGETAEGIKLGASRDDILKKYKNPDSEIQLPKGHLMVYTADQIIFWLEGVGENQKLIKWCVYRMKPEPK